MAMAIVVNLVIVKKHPRNRRIYFPFFLILFFKTSYLYRKMLVTDDGNYQQPSSIPATSGQPIAGAGVLTQT